MSPVETNYPAPPEEAGAPARVDVNVNHIHEGRRNRLPIPHFLHSKLGALAAGVSLAVLGAGAEAYFNHDLPRSHADVSPSPALLTSIGWSEDVIVDSGHGSKSITAEKSWGGNVPIIGGGLKWLTKHPIENGVVGEVQVLLQPKAGDTPGTTMSWYPVPSSSETTSPTNTTTPPTISGSSSSNKPAKVAWGVKIEADYRQFKVQEAAVQCQKVNEKSAQCISNVQNSILHKAINWSPLFLATGPLKDLSLIAKVPLIGGIAAGVANVLGDDANAAQEVTDLYQDAQQDLGNECSQPLLQPTTLEYGIAKAARIELNGMASFDWTRPELRNVANIYRTAARLPILVEITNGPGTPASQADMKSLQPAAVDAKTLGQQLGASSSEIHIKGDSTCKLDGLASQQLKNAMSHEVQLKSAALVSAEASQAASKN